MNLITVVRGLAAFSWIAVVAVVVFLVVRAARDKNTKGMVSMIVIVIVFPLVIIQFPGELFSVSTRNRDI